jgi:hypothetical protein
MDTLKLWRAACAMILVAGCSGGKSPEPAAASAADSPPAKTVFDPLTQQLQRAKDVQGTADQSADRQRQNVDAQERGNAPP